MDIIANIVPARLYGSAPSLPDTKTINTDFDIATINPSFSPKSNKVTNRTILERPSFTPGTGIGMGIILSKSDIIIANDIKIPNFTVFLNS